MIDPRLGLIVVAAGSSRRMAGIDKVWAPLEGRPVVWRALAELAPHCSMTVLVVHPDRLDEARADLCTDLPELRVVPGGENRQQSVMHGLAALRDIPLVAVHDAARPFAPASLLHEGAKLLETCDGAVPVQPVRDTIKRVDADDNVLCTVDRDALRAAQTPQLFRFDALHAAHLQAAQRGHVGTDDASLLEAAGYRVKTFPGRPGNFKITTPRDLELAHLMLRDGIRP